MAPKIDTSILADGAALWRARRALVLDVFWPQMLMPRHRSDEVVWRKTTGVQPAPKTASAADTPPLDRLECHYATVLGGTL